jgi:hypothetical protein
MHIKVAKQLIVFFRHARDSTQRNAQQRLRLHGLSEERWAPDEHSLAHQATPHAQ